VSFPQLDDLLQFNDSNIKGQLYADDGIIWTEGLTLESRMERLQEACDHITRWSLENKLQFSKEKTNLLIFTNKKKLNKQIDIQLCGFKVTRAASYKYLGLTLEEKGGWKLHFNEIQAKLKKTHGWLSTHIRKNGPPNPATMIKIVKSITKAQFTYAISMWQPTETQLKTLDSLHLKTYKRILGLDRNTSSDLIRHELVIPKAITIRQMELIRTATRMTELESKHPAHQETIAAASNELPSRLRKTRTFAQQINQAWETLQTPTDLTKESLILTKLAVKKTTISNNEQLKVLRTKEDEKCIVPTYLNRTNPTAWITTKLRFGQAWNLHRSKLDPSISTYCRNEQCMENGIQETVAHVIGECPTHLLERNSASIKLSQLGYYLTPNLILGDLSRIKKQHIPRVETYSSTFIQNIVKVRPI
jgi:Reverse transcriptase (RNA-dependent DNA polymerase)